MFSWIFGRRIECSIVVYRGESRRGDRHWRWLLKFKGKTVAISARRWKTRGAATLHAQRLFPDWPVRYRDPKHEQEKLKHFAKGA